MWVGGYTLVRPLGRGGIGTVWEAEDGAGVRVALKLLHPAQAATEEGRHRLVRQARLVNQIPSDQVAKVLDVEADALVPFVVTELIDGPSLASALADASLTYEGAARLGAGVATTLREVHRRSVAHRDIKPSNIVMRSGVPVLIDFDLSRTEDEATLTRGPLLGTPGYVAPELLDNRTPALNELIVGDWYAWAATLLSALTGRPPFAGAAAAQILQSARDGHPDTRGLPPALSDAFGKALAPDPSNRSRPVELLEALRAANLPQVTKPLAAPLTPTAPPRPVPQQTAFAQEFDSAMPDSHSAPRWLPLYGSKRHPLVGTLLFILLGALPALFPGIGLVLLVGLVSVIVVAGERQLRMRIRLRSAGEPSGSLVRFVTFPFRAAWVLLRMVPAVLVSLVVAFVSTWAVASVVSAEATAADVVDWYFGSSPPDSLALWVGTSLGLLAFWAAPSSRNLREGIASTMRSFAPGRFGQLLVGLALAFLVVGVGLVLVGHGT